MESSENGPKPTKTYPRWLTDPFGMVADWFENNPPEKSAYRDAEKMIKLMLKGEAGLAIKAMRFFLKDDVGEGGHFFDKIKGDVVGIAREIPKRSPFQEQGRSKQTEMQRWVFATYAGGLLNSAKGNSPLDTSIRGIAWSLLANDARNVLVESGQTIDTEWLYGVMGPLMRGNKDSRLVGEELSRFTKGDPAVIYEQPLVVSK
jgi:hypothetical protein